MKKILVALFSILVVNANAQKIEEGTSLIGGSVSFQTTKGNNSVVINPNYGYFVANNFAVGANLNVSFRKEGDTKTNQFGLGPFARYYIGESTTKPFVVTEFSYQNRSIKLPEIGKTKTNGFDFLIGMGFAAFINDMVAVEGVTGYNYSKFKNVEGGSGFTMRFGFQIYLGRDNYRNPLK